MDWLDAEPLRADFTGLPTYRVNSVIRRDLGDGEIGIVNCWQQNGLIIPLCRIVIATAHMIEIGKSGNEFAKELRRRRLVATLHGLRMDGTAH